MTTTAAPALRPAHRDANVLRWLAAYTASMLGDGVYFLALGFAAAKSLPPAEVGMVMATGSVPRAALMLGGGVVADRFGPRRVVIGSDAVRCVLILSAAAALALSSPGLWLLIAVALVFGVVDALFLPAVGALPPRLVAPGQMMRLQGLRALAMRFGNIAGPPAGGLAMGLGGPSAAFATAGVLFAVSVPLLAGLRIGPPTGRAAAVQTAGQTAARTGTEVDTDVVTDVDAGTHTGTGTGTGMCAEAGRRVGARGSRATTAWQELRDGLRLIRADRLVGPLVVSGAVCELGLAGPLNVGMVLLCQDRGWGSSGYGWIIGAFGAGSAAGALLLTVRGWLPRAGVVQIGTLLVSSATIGMVALAGSAAAAAAVALLAGLAGGVCGGLAIALVQSAVDPSYLGRVTAVMSLTGFGLAPLSYPVFGAAVAAWGPTPVFLAAAGLACLGGAVGLAAPEVRRAELSRPPGR